MDLYRYLQNPSQERLIFLAKSTNEILAGVIAKILQ
jgi:hypothetical protein